MNISKILRLRRQQLGITQLELAHYIGWETKGAVAKLEAGIRPWRFVNVVKACELLKLKITIEIIN